MRRRRSTSSQVRRPLSTAKKIERAFRGIPTVLLACVVLWMGFAFVKKLIRPVYLYYREQKEISQIQSELSNLHKENGHLKKQNRYLRQPEGAQIEARKLGYVRPGEISIMIEQKPRTENTR